MKEPGIVITAGDHAKPLTIMGIPVRIDETLCEPDEVWLENANGDAVRVLPEDEN